MGYKNIKTGLYTLLLAALPLALASCATPYQRAGLSNNYGYSVQRVSKDTYRAVFQANSSTSPQKIQDFAYLSAAQVTLRHNFKYFEVLNETNESFTTFIPPESYFRFSTGMGYYSGHRHGHYHGSVGHWTVRPGRSFINPGFGLLIKCLTKKSDADKHSAGVYDAKSLQKSLIEKYKKEDGANITPVLTGEDKDKDKDK